jgi:hypothetical protein
MPPTDMYIKDLTKNDSGTKLKKPLLNIFVKGSFTPSGEIVACELEYRFGAITKSTWGFFRTGEWEPLGYHSVISFYKDGVKRLTYDAKDFGLPKGTFLEHPRVSPDGRFLTFYTQSAANVQGIYVYNLEKKTTTYMGNFLDKHPTWSADGKRIFFHEQGQLAGTKEEIARIGYYDLDFVGDEVKLGKRNLLWNHEHALGSDYIYQKHPAYHPGLDVVFFHARNGLDGKKSIGAISMAHPERPPVFLELSIDGEKVTHAEHVDVSDRVDSPLYFVARMKGEKVSRLMKISIDGLKGALKDLLK